MDASSLPTRTFKRLLAVLNRGQLATLDDGPGVLKTQCQLMKAYTGNASSGLKLALEAIGCPACWGKRFGWRPWKPSHKDDDDKIGADSAGRLEALKQWKHEGRRASALGKSLATEEARFRQGRGESTSCEMAPKTPASSPFAAFSVQSACGSPGQWSSKRCRPRKWSYVSICKSHIVERAVSNSGSHQVISHH